MGLFSSSKQWSNQAKDQQKYTRARRKAQAIRTRQIRAANRRHAIEHPIRHLLSR